MRVPIRFCAMSLLPNCARCSNPVFGLNYANVIDPLLHDMRVFVLQFAGMEAGESVLDVCCGSGAQVFEYAKQRIVATGIDSNPSMLRLAQKYARKFGSLNTSFQVADAANLPFDDSSFDFTSISLALHEKENSMRDLIIFEMRRVTRRSGSLIFIDFSTPLPRNALAFAIRKLEFLAGCQHHKHFRDYVTHGGLERILEHNGLKAAKRAALIGGNITIELAPNI